MNKGLHRIIFSKKHGTMVAVAETANSRGKGRQAGSSAPLAAGVSDGLCFKLKTGTYLVYFECLLKFWKSGNALFNTKFYC